MSDRKAQSGKIKVLVLSHTSEMIGGAERSMLDLFDVWSNKYNVEPIFILREPLGTLVGEMNKRKWKYYPVKFTFWSYPNPPTKHEDIFNHSVQNSSAVEEIENIIINTKPDIVITNTIISPWAALAAHFQGVPHIWFVREYGDLDHGREFEISHQQTYEDIGNLSNLVVANSRTLASHIEQYVNKEKVVTLYNPFNLTSIAERASANATSPFKYPDSLKLIMTGNISRSKGQLEAVEATVDLNNRGYLVELCLAGKNVDKSYHQDIEEVIQKNRLTDKIHLVGLQSNIPALVSLSDVGIVASKSEAFGRTTFEFLAVGKPVVGANGGATPEMVKPGDNGYLYEPGNRDQLVAALANYAIDKSLITKHGLVSRQKAETMMHGKQNADALYEKIQVVAHNDGQSKSQPIHFLHQWMYYQRNAKQFIDESGKVSIRKTARMRLRQKAKDNYYRVRKAKSRLSGK